MNNEFLNMVNSGKWFVVVDKYKNKFAVKMKRSKYDEKGIHSVWLSKNDSEAMAVEDYFEKDWIFQNNIFENNGAGVYHFGSTEASDDCSIYDENYNVIDEKLYRAILDNVESEFITKEELVSVWSSLKDGSELGFEVLKCK